MITDRSQYEFASIPDEIMVNGGIMPQRDVEGGDAWRVLRGEDLAFAVEATIERCRAVAMTHDCDATVTREVKGSAWVDVVLDLTHVCHAFARRNAALDVLYRAAPIPASATLTGLFPDIAFQLSDLMARPDDFEPGAPLRADGVRRVYHDLGIMTRFPANCTYRRTSDEFTVTDIEGVPGDATATGDVVLNHVAYDLRSGQVGTEGSETALMSEGGLSLAPAGASFEHAGSASVLVELAFENVISNTSGPVTTERFWYAAPMAGAGDGDGGVYVAHDAVVALALNLSRGYFKTGLTVGDGLAQDLTVRLVSTRALVDLDEHTDFSDIGWVWPAAS